MTSIKNIFSFPYINPRNADNDVIAFQNLGADRVFHAEYDYGPKEEQISKLNIIIYYIQSLMTRLIESHIFWGVSWIKDSEKLKIDTNQLRAIGGKSVTMKTPDGDIINGMHIKASEFKKYIKKYFEFSNKLLIDELKGLMLNEFKLKEEFCVESSYTDDDGIKRSHFTPNEEGWDILNAFENLGLQVVQQGHPLSNPAHPDQSKQKSHGCLLKSTSHIEDCTLPLLDPPPFSPPTVLITGGVNASSLFYKKLAVYYLMRGLDVMMVDFRGYGNSQGRPTAYKTKLDMETAYQYLAKEHNVKNKDLLLHGHCFGAAPATDLAARRKGVSIVVDRSFSKFQNIVAKEAEEMFESETAKTRIRSIVQKILPWIIDYDNSKNLEKIRGNIAIVMDREDAFTENRWGEVIRNPNAFITEDDVMEQINSLPNNDNKNQVLRLFYPSVGHAGSWINSHISLLQLKQFLIDTNLARQVFA